MGEKPENIAVRLCYESNGYVFILKLSEEDLKNIRTRKLMGMHRYGNKFTLTVVKADNIALYPFNIYRMYNIPDAGFRIHLNVPISSDMDWVCPAYTELSVFIYFEG